MSDSLRTTFAVLAEHWPIILATSAALTALNFIVIKTISWLEGKPKLLTYDTLFIGVALGMILGIKVTMP